MPGTGRARTISVFHHDGVGWTKLGGDLQGPPFPLSFALGQDDTPYVVAADSSVQMFQQQAWKPLPTLPDGVSLPFLSSAIELDQTGPVLLTADASDNRAMWEGRAHPRAFHSRESANRSIEQLRQLADRTGALVVFGHDAENWAELAHAPESYR